jgi:EpsI family protein
MKALTTSVLIAALMVTGAATGYVARPGPKQAIKKNSEFKLEAIVPKAFGDWKMVPSTGNTVVNPQTQEMLDQLYSQVLTRSYVNSQGYVIMLSLAYGDDQRGGLQTHRPEVCYPAQGFKLAQDQSLDIPTSFGKIAGKRLDTQLGNRHEPLTYWLTVGGKPITSDVERRVMEVRLALTGQIPDGLLFRVSSIDPDTNPNGAWRKQQAFVEALLGAVPEKERRRLSGLGPAISASTAGS